MASLNLTLNYEEGGTDKEMFEGLPVDITIGQLIEKYKMKTGCQTFTYEMYIELDNNLEYEINKDDTDVKIVDILNLENEEDFETVHEIYLRIQSAGSSKDNLKFTLWNAYHEDVQVKVRYTAVVDRLQSKATNIEVGGIGLDLASGGLPSIAPEIAYGKEKKYFEKPAMERQQDKADLHNVGAHKSKVISINSGIIGNVINLEIIQKDKQNKEGEIDSITCGKHYVIYRLASSGKLGTFVRKSRKWSPLDKMFGSNTWKDKEERDYDPHGCLAKGEDCDVCQTRIRTNGWMVKDKNFPKNHVKYALIDGKCPVACQYNKLPTQDQKSN